MALQKFIESIWEKSEKDLNELEQMKKALENLQQSENKIYLVTVESNNG